MGKRPMLEIIDAVYHYIEMQGGEIFASNLREVVSNPNNVLDIIKDVQERPYLYFKTQYPSHSALSKSIESEEDGQSGKIYTILKLSTQKRNPKTRYIQLPEIIEFLENKMSNLGDMTKAELDQVLMRTYDALVKINNRDGVPINYFL